MVCTGQEEGRGVEQVSFVRAVSRGWRSKGFQLIFCLGRRYTGYYLEACDELMRYDLKVGSCRAL